MFDAHTHLQDERLDGCRDAVIAAALAAGVRGACCCGSSPDDWEKVGALRHAAFHILPAFGVHPWYAGNLATDWLDRLEERLVQHPESPVGEIGIDGLRDEPPVEVQRQVLRAQLELAVRLRRPVELHGARAWGELLAILQPFAPRLPGFVAHAFSGSREVLREILARGGFVSFAGSVCNPASRRVREAAAAVPSDRLLLETDTPDLLPRTAAPDPDAVIPMPLNHPANLVHVAQAVAELRGAPVDEIAAITTANACRVLRMTEG